MTAQMLTLAVVPVRYAAARFPGKPLADLGGRPLVQWVYERARQCAAFDLVVVATDDERIADVVRGFGGMVELTSPDHPSGTDRVAEVAGRYREAAVVVNVQGDQPFVTPAILERLVAPFGQNRAPAITTAACPLQPADWANPNVVKVVRGLDGRALYFSRSGIPWHAEEDEVRVRPLHHLGLYAYAREALFRLSALAPTPLEVQERLEQLRALEHGFEIQVVDVDEPVLEVNTPDDLERARAFVAQGTVA